MTIQLWNWTNKSICYPSSNTGDDCSSFATVKPIQGILSLYVSERFSKKSFYTFQFIDSFHVEPDQSHCMEEVFST